MFINGLVNLLQKFTKDLIRFNSERKEKWDLFVIFVVLYDLILMPYSIAFITNPSIILKILDAIINIIFFADIILMLYTTYQDHRGHEIKDHQ